MKDDPHAGQPVATLGPSPAAARAAMILLHGRGATADGILGLARELHHPGFACLAPQAAGGTWYPRTFLAPLEINEPWLSSALAKVGAVLEGVADAGIDRARVILLGFSQGACLALEFAARNAARYGAVVGLTGGLLGPSGRAFDFAGDFGGTPVLLAAGDPDLHVPWLRVAKTARVLGDLGAEVDLRRRPGLGHAIHPDELGRVRELMDAIAPV